MMLYAGNSNKSFKSVTKSEVSAVRLIRTGIIARPQPSSRTLFSLAWRLLEAMFFYFVATKFHPAAKGLEV
jgi:hypothetical protein